MISLFKPKMEMPRASYPERDVNTKMKSPATQEYSKQEKMFNEYELQRNKALLQTAYEAVMGVSLPTIFADWKR